jgi:hypothetical protein
MGSNNSRRIALAALLVGVVVLVRMWQAEAPAPSPAGDGVAKPGAAAPAEPTPGPARAPASEAQVAVVPSTPAAPQHRPAPAPAPLRLRVDAPTDVRVGDVFEARVDVDAGVPVSDLMFSIAYEKSRLSLVGRTQGAFVRQPGMRSEFGVDEPSDGNVEVIFRAMHGTVAAGSGGVVVLELEAIRPGASRIELQNVRSAGPGGEAMRGVALEHASVTIH